MYVFINVPFIIWLFGLLCEKDERPLQNRTGLREGVNKKNLTTKVLTSPLKPNFSYSGYYVK